MKTYIISVSEYMGMLDTMYEFQGTWRQLLEHLNNVTDENREDPLDDAVSDGRKVKDLSDEELVELFYGANGDGQSFYMVWCVEDRKRVL